MRTDTSGSCFEPDAWLSRTSRLRIRLRQPSSARLRRPQGAHSPAKGSGPGNPLPPESPTAA
jgi:hypothetical protein